MSVIRTDQWLKEGVETTFKRLSKSFSGASIIEIIEHFKMFGMYEPTKKDFIYMVNQLNKKAIWKTLQKEFELLRQKWKGPDVPIYIFPSDPTNRKLIHEFNGKSGLAFKDQLFLFISEHNSLDELKALLTHEYNHVCRLSQYRKSEKDYVLLDTIILEGLAEQAVSERFGVNHTADWTELYSDKQLKHMWENIIYPNCHILKGHPKHQELLYGLRSLPHMIGYCVGYYLVGQYKHTKNTSSEDLISLPSETIAMLNNEKTDE